MALTLCKAIDCEARSLFAMILREAVEMSLTV
jgi:hypothetical protein